METNQIQQSRDEAVPQFGSATVNQFKRIGRLEQMQSFEEVQGEAVPLTRLFGVEPSSGISELQDIALF